MPVIPNEQTDSIKAVAIQKFELEMLEHMAAYAPKLHELYGDTVFQTMIRQGIQQAFVYGFSYRGPIRLYIELMFSLGHRFDTDPQYPWCRKILNDHNDPDQMRRAERLFAATDRYVTTAFGKANQHVVTALQRLKDDKTFFLQLFQTNRETSILAVLQGYYPEKTRAIGQRALISLVHRAQQEAENYDVATRQGANLLCVLMFIFGHSVMDDPLYPWVKRTLNGARFQQSNQRIGKLSAKTGTYMSAVGNYFIHSDFP